MFSFEELHIFAKLSFVNSIKYNDIKPGLFASPCDTKRNNRSKSFVQDIKDLGKRFNLRVCDIYLECNINT